MEGRIEKVVARGTFAYDGKAPMEVCIVARNFDAGFEHAELADQLTHEPLGPDGFLYSVEPGWARNFRSVEEAKLWTSQQLWAPVTWCKA
jgi:hypothetical protein